MASKKRWRTWRAVERINGRTYAVDWIGKRWRIENEREEGVLTGRVIATSDDGDTFTVDHPRNSSPLDVYKFNRTLQRRVREHGQKSGRCTRDVVQSLGRSLSFLAKLPVSREQRVYFELVLGDLRRDALQMLTQGVPLSAVRWIARWRCTSAIGHALWDWLIRRLSDLAGTAALWRTPPKS